MNDHVLSIDELKKHLNNLINALIALCPTRNYISQFLMFLPEDYALMYDSFPEFLSDKVFRGQLQTLLGLSLGPRIQYLPSSFAKRLVQILEFTFEMLNDEKRLKEWNNFLGDVRSEKIPNIFREWILAKIQIAIGDPVHGKLARGILKVIYENQMYQQASTVAILHNNTRFKRDISIEELAFRLQISQTELEPTLLFLKNKLKIIQCTEQKVEESLHRVVSLADSINMSWLTSLLQEDTTLPSGNF